MELKNVQISEELFVALLKYHLVEIDDVLPQIKKGLEEKLEAMVRQDLYTKYKTASTEEERAKASSAGNAGQVRACIQISQTYRHLS